MGVSYRGFLQVALKLVLGLGGALAMSASSACLEDDCLIEQSCTSSADCGAGDVFRCVEGQCTKRFCFDEGKACGEIDEVCESQQCSTPPGGKAICTSGLLQEGWSCISSSECASGRCDDVTLVCIPLGSIGSACNQDIECEPDLFCRVQDCTGIDVRGKCKARLGLHEPCCSYEQCEPGLSCREDDCDSGETSHCRPLASTGGACCADRDCKIDLECRDTSAALRECQ